MSDWDPIAAWWEHEVSHDPFYVEDVLPMVDRLLGGAAGPLLDLGCGEGSHTVHVGAAVPGTFGCDGSMRLLRRAVERIPVVRCRLPELSWVAGGVLGAATAIYVLDLIEDAGAFFAETARIVRRGGILVVIVNHPVYTAPGSAPFMDQDGEVLWRWGRYFDEGPSPTMAGGVPITLHHRPLSGLVTLAAGAGWALESMEESGLGDTAIAREPGYAGQESVPRILGLRWRRGDSR